MRALRSFTDEFGHERKTGEEWLITQKDADTHIPSVYSEVLENVSVTALSNRQYAIIVNPVDKEGRTQLGAKRLVNGM
jgi:major vault protein